MIETVQIVKYTVQITFHQEKNQLNRHIQLPEWKMKRCESTHARTHTHTHTRAHTHAHHVALEALLSVESEVGVHSINHDLIVH